MSLGAPRNGRRRSACSLPALRGLGLLCGLLVLGGYDAAQPGASGSPTAAAAATVQTEASRMWMTVGERRFSITLADNEAAHALDRKSTRLNSSHQKISYAVFC